MGIYFMFYKKEVIAENCNNRPLGLLNPEDV